jgi:hypothetical protein
MPTLDFFPDPSWLPRAMHFLFGELYSEPAILAIVSHCESTGSAAGCLLFDSEADRQTVQCMLPVRATGPNRYEDFSGVRRAATIGRGE